MPQSHFWRYNCNTAAGCYIRKGGKPMETKDYIVNSCRICGSGNLDGEFEGVIENDGSSLSAVGKLYEELLGLHIEAHKQNDLPQYLCKSCVLHLRLFQELKEKASKTLSTSRTRFGRLDKVNANEISSAKSNNYYETVSCPTDPEETQQKAMTCTAIDDVEQREVRTEIVDFERAHLVVSSSHAAEDDHDIKHDDQKVNLGVQITTDVNEESEDGALHEELVELLYVHNENDSPDNKSDDMVEFLYDLNEKEFTATESISAGVEWDVRNEVECKRFACAECSENEWETESAYRAHLEQHLVRLEDNYDFSDEFDEQDDGGFKPDSINNCDVNMDEDYVKPKDAETLMTLGRFDFNYTDESGSAAATDNSNCDFLDVHYLEDFDECESNVGSPPAKQQAKRQRSAICRKCNVEFADLAMYKEHRKVTHSNKFQCHECGRELMTLVALRVHMKLHQGQPEYKCDKCQRTFYQKVHYKYHMDMHNNIRNFKCELCLKAFLSKSDLATHVRLHSGARPFACDLCDKDFLLSQHLKMHRYSHFDKAFECDLCKQKFTSPSTLRTHRKTIHTSQPQFPCELCAKKFRRKHHLLSHYRVHERAMSDRIEPALVQDDQSQCDPVIEIG